MREGIKPSGHEVSQGRSGVGCQWQVLQEPEEQLEQPDEDPLIRLEPPPMPKPEMSFLTSADPHLSQTTSFSLPALTRHSNLWPHFWHLYS
jgi:hypothetical protein